MTTRLIEALASVKAAVEQTGITEETEADTRARIIDPVLAASGWAPDAILREPYNKWKPDPGFLDYALLVRGKPRFVIEVKKGGRTFAIPELLARSGNITLEKLLHLGSRDLEEAVSQCCRYAAHCGASYACATNGREFIFFKPFQAGRSQGAAKVIVFASVESALRRIDVFARLIGRNSVESGDAEVLLAGREVEAPDFAKRLREKYSPRAYVDFENEEYSHIADSLIRSYIEDVADDEAFARCYVHSKWSNATQRSLEGAVESYAAGISDGRQGKASGPGEQSLLRVAPAGRTVILHGSIGAGKTAFLRYLRVEFAKRHGAHVVWVHLDLLDFRDTIFAEEHANKIANKLNAEIRRLVALSTQRIRRAVDPDEWRHLRDIYNHEATAFRKSRYPDSNDEDPVYLQALRDYVWDLRQQDPQDHLIRTLAWLTCAQRVPVVLVLDNTDQLGVEFQEFLYRLTVGFHARTSALSVLCLRTEALQSHEIKQHSLANVEERYEVQRSSLIDVLAARLDEMERQIEGIRKKDLKLSATCDRLSVLAEMMQAQLEHGDLAIRLVEIIGNGNLRRALGAVARIFRIGQKTMDGFVRQHAGGRLPRLQFSSVLKAILRGQHGRYQSGAPDALVPNLLTVDAAVVEPHSLSVRILEHVRALRDSGDPPTVADVCSAFAAAGYDGSVVRRILQRLHSEQLLTASHLFRDLRDVDVLRTTVLADGMVKHVLSSPEYVDALVWDTVIYERAAYEGMAAVWRSSKRAFDKTIAMRNLFVDYVCKQEDHFYECGASDLLEIAARVGLRERWRHLFAVESRE